MRAARRSALAVSAFVLIASSVVSLAGSVTARATNSGAQAHGAPLRQASSATLGGTLYFRADDGIHGPELWKSDGTAAGTVMVKDIRPGPTGSNPGLLTLVRGVLFFRANDGEHGSALWESDGTKAGTALVKDINPARRGSHPVNLVEARGELFFRVVYRDHHWDALAK